MYGPNNDFSNIHMVRRKFSLSDPMRRTKFIAPVADRLNSVEDSIKNVVDSIGYNSLCLVCL